MKNILIPTDFSVNSWNALKYSLSFFKDIEATFYFLHVSIISNGDNNDDAHLSDSNSSNNDNEIQEKFNSLLEKTNRLSKNKNHHFVTIHDHLLFIKSIRKHVEEKGIDFIVMGTKGGNTALKDVTLGSYTEDVITRVKCNALIIPEKSKFRKLKEIVFPTDFNIFYKNNVLNTISDFIMKYNTTLNVLNISKKEKPLRALQLKNKKHLQESLNESNLDFHFVANENIENGLQSFVEEKEIDMIAIVAKNLNFSQRILFRPTVAKISYHTEIPFLILHE